MQPRQYAREGERLIKTLRERGERPKLLLHSCCAPCSSHVLSLVREAFDVTVYYYNPNISPQEEYEKRKKEQLRLLSAWEIPHLDCDYEGESFAQAVRGLEKEPERGARCEVCFRLRLGKTAWAAKAAGFDYFCTTLTVSPHKDAELLNRIGEEEGVAAGVPFLPSDFKKRGGYLRSIRLSEEHGLYRQDYCGCAFSKAEREEQKRIKAAEEKSSPSVPQNQSKIK